MRDGIIGRDIMTWTITVKADKYIEKKDVKQALENLGDVIKKQWYPGFTFTSEQSWGWPGYLCDVYFPSGSELVIHGAWSNPNGPTFAKLVSKELNKLGYETKVGRKSG
jgi:hypothetical protein